MAKPQSNVNVASKMLQTFLGLDPAAVKKVMVVVQKAGMLPDIKTQQMKRRVGLRAMTLITKAMEAAEEEMSKKQDNESVADEAPKKEVKESTFLNYLMTELATGEVDYSGTDDSKLSTVELQKKRKQMASDGKAKSRDRRSKSKDLSKSQKIALQNEKHRAALQTINDEEAAKTGE